MEEGEVSGSNSYNGKYIFLPSVFTNADAKVMHVIYLCKFYTYFFLIFYVFSEKLLNRK